MGRFALLYWLAALAGLVASGAAAAHSVELGELTCTAGADSLEAALDYTPDELRCTGDRFGDRDRFVRTSALLKGKILPATSGLVWQTEASDFASMLVRFTFADGTRRIVDVDPQMAARNWFAGNRFDIPVPEEATPLVAVDTVVETPHAKATLGQARILTERESNRAHYVRSLGYVLVLGLLFLPLVYDLLFYRILRQSFILWHFAMVTAMVAYTLLHSGLVFVPFPDFPLDMRWRLTSVCFVTAMACAVMMLRGLIEQKHLGRRLSLALVIAALIPAAVKLVSLIAGDALRLTINPVYLMSFLPAALIVIGVAMASLAKGSRGARWALLGFVPLIAAGILRLLQALEWIHLPFTVEDAVFLGLVLLAVITAMGVGDRFLTLKEDRDQARTQAIRLGQMANTDGLTGLANRRAFDMIVRLKTGQGLIVADVDHFKAINDEHGHQVGDAVLCHVATLLRGALGDRPSARIFRLGGEEFAIIVEAIEGHELMNVAEQLRETVARTDAKSVEFDLPQTHISLGAVLGHGQLMHQAFADADAALYRAKNGGRNRTVLHSAPAGEEPAQA